VRRYSLILLAIIVLVGAGLELGVRGGLPRLSHIIGRLKTEQAKAVQLKPLVGQPVPVLIVGNSLLLDGVDISALDERLRPKYRVTRFVVENTSYLDWYYGLRRLFREGARPKIVILVFSARHLLDQSICGDSCAYLLVDWRDILSVKHDTVSDNTTTSNLLFATVSGFYGFRAELRKWVLLHLMPDFPGFAAKLRSKSTPLQPDEEIEKGAMSRLSQLSSLCQKYGAQLILVMPPSNAPRDGSAAVQRAGNRLGVPVLVPFKPQQLPSQLYSDGYHLNPRGAQIFTEALGPELRQLLQGDNFVQSTQSNRSSHGSEISSSVVQGSR
jgi:hypothetical protein